MIAFFENFLDFSENRVMIEQIIESPLARRAGFFLRGQPFTMWAPEVWNHENFRKGGCQHGKWNGQMV